MKTGRGADEGDKVTMVLWLRDVLHGCEGIGLRGDVGARSFLYSRGGAEGAEGEIKMGPLC